MQYRVLSQTETVDLLGVLTIHPEIRNLGRWVYETYGPIALYENPTPESDFISGDGIDMSIWWGCLHDRYYSEPRFQSNSDETNSILRNLYFFHEFCHMLVNPGESQDPKFLARVFDHSERLASYLSEVWIHKEIPWLAGQLPFGENMLHEFFPNNMSISDGIFLRNRIIEDDDFILPRRFQKEQARLRPYRGNLAWAEEKFTDFPLKDLGGFSAGFYETILETTDPKTGHIAPSPWMRFSPERNLKAFETWSKKNA